MSHPREPWVFRGAGPHESGFDGAVPIRIDAIVDALLAATPRGGEVTLDAIGEALDLAHDFDKVPMFNILCKAYSDAVKHISKQVAELQQQLMHEKLGFSLVDHTFSRK